MIEREEALEPCPFCGGPARATPDGAGWPLVVCSSCGAYVEAVQNTDDPVIRWNRRASSPPPKGGEWRDIESAPKDGTVIWAVLRADLYPRLHPARDDLQRWNGLQAPLRHPGVARDGFDIGWNIALPVGHGGFPDEWIAGWQPLPAAPDGKATPPDEMGAEQPKAASEHLLTENARMREALEIAQSMLKQRGCSHAEIDAALRKD